MDTIRLAVLFRAERKLDGHFVRLRGIGFSKVIFVCVYMYIYTKDICTYIKICWWKLAAELVSSENERVQPTVLIHKLRKLSQGRGAYGGVYNSLGNTRFVRGKLTSVISGRGVRGDGRFSGTLVESQRRARVRRTIRYTRDRGAKIRVDA